MITLLIVILVSILATLLWLGFSDAEARKQADYDVRELAGELTPEEIRAEAMEERSNYERRTSAKEVIQL